MVGLWQLTSSALLALTALGCASQSKYLNDQDWTRERGDEKMAWRETESLFNEEESDADRFRAEPQGVRHDLTMVEAAKPSARCNCLDVVVGPGGSRDFAWTGELPVISKQHLLFAMRPRDRQCQGGQTISRPSIRAVDTAGKHVIVVIEELPFDRPAAQGAIITKPKEGGAVWLRSHKRVQPYGGSQSLPDPNLTAAERWERRLCRVYGEPGPAGNRQP